MPLSFRGRLFATLSIAIFGLIVLTVSGVIITDRVAVEMDKIESRYVPLVELRPSLDAHLEEIGRAFQDAVAEGNRSRFGEAEAARDGFIRIVEGASKTLRPSTRKELRDSIRDYYDAAQGVAVMLMTGEAGIEGVEAISAMQAKRSRVRDILQEATVFNRRTLAETFRLAKGALNQADRIRLTIGLICLIAVLTLSWLLSRDMIRSLSTLSNGLSQFGRGELASRIEMKRNDEFGELAKSANEMARRIEFLLGESETKSQALQRANELLASANRELESFSYSVSHDLRAPLRAIDGFSKALANEYGDQVEERGQHYLSRIRAGTQRMSRLIDDILTLSRIGRASISREEVDMTALITSVAEEIQNRDCERNVTFDVEPKLFVHGDARLLRIVIENLLSNAWKFTSKKGQAHVEAGRDSDTGAIYVKDNGAGFNMAAADKLFGAFQRLHSEQEFEGTGIGLATVQRIVSKHGGKVWADAKEGEGATFYFALGEER